MYIQNPVNFYSYGNSVQQKIVQTHTPENISFKAVVKRAPFKQSTVDTINSFYEKYKKSTLQLSVKDISSTVDKILQEEKDFSKEEVISAMQVVTQFANLESLKRIVPHINKDNIVSIGNKNCVLQKILEGMPDEFVKTLCNDNGLNSVVDYLLNQKKFFNNEISSSLKKKKPSCVAIFLDKNKISDLELLKKRYPKEFDKMANNKRIKFYYLSGFDEGITFLNRNENLESQTRCVLNLARYKKSSFEDAIQLPYKDRMKELGIKITTVKNENSPTVLNIFKQLRNNTMTKNELFNLVEANTLTRTVSFFHEKFNEMTAKDINKNLNIYTPEKMSAMLKNLYSKILEYAKEKKIDEKNIIYIIPDSKRVSKSFHLINYSYEKINNIPHNKFVELERLNKISSNNKLFVVLDDCAISGASAHEISIRIADKMWKNKLDNVVFANLVVSNKFINKYNNYAGKYFNKSKPIFVDTVNSSDSLVDRQLHGQAKFDIGNASYSVVFPYMAPDNDCELASNIAILHHPNYSHGDLQKNKFACKGIGMVDSIKNLDSKVMDILKKQIELIGTVPDVKKEKNTIGSFLKNLFS